MDRALELSLVRKSLEVVGAKGPPLDADEWAVPVERYLDVERFAVERRYFRRSLNAVAHVADLAEPGAFVTRELLGSPILVVRAPDGQIRAFLNVCRHRGARIESRDHGQCKRFVCPYHAWTYRTDGALDHVRHPEGFPSLEEANVALTELTTVTHGPFVWVCPDPRERPELDPDLRAFVDEIAGIDGGTLAPFAAESKLWNTNWKIVVEGGIESYHFKIAHRATIGGLFTDTRSTFERRGLHLRSVLPRTSLAGLRELPEAEWSLLQHANVVYALAPNLSVLVQDGHYVLVQSDPVAIDQTRITLTTVGRPVVDGEKGERRRQYLEANHRFTVETLMEDFELAEQIQAGLASGANEILRFGRYEDALTAWHHALDERLLQSTSRIDT